MIVTSNKPFSAWSEIFGDEVTATGALRRRKRHTHAVSGSA
jgi:hypothetical protein